MAMNKVAVVAVGGNSLIKDKGRKSVPDQYEAAAESMGHIAGMIEDGWDVVITHGNGPQVGNALIRVEETRDLVPPLPLGIIVADLEGGMGYMIEQSLQNLLSDAGINKDVTTILTQVLVDPKDPSILNPSKFIGPFYKQEQIQNLLRICFP